MPDVLTLEQLRDDLAYINAQLERPDAPFTLRTMLETRKQALEEAIESEQGIDQKTATVALVFGGEPVVGASAIDLEFSSKALDRFQVFVSNVYAEMIADQVAERGPIKGRDRSRLFIQDVVHGSMGFVLSEEPKRQEEAFPTEMNQALSRALTIIDQSASQDNREFDAMIDATSPRSIASLSRLADVVRGANATVRFASSAVDRYLASDDVERMFARLHDVAKVEEPVFVAGQLRGIFPERAEYEFVVSDGSVLHGRAHAELVQRYLEEAGFRENFIARPVVAQFRRTTIRKAGQADRSDHLLESIVPQATLSQSAQPRLE